MEIFGIRQAKAHLSQLVRAAAAGECSLVSDNRKPVAMIGPLPAEFKEVEASPRVEQAKPLTDAATFRKALLGAPYPLELDF